MSQQPDGLLIKSEEDEELVHELHVPLLDFEKYYGVESWVHCFFHVLFTIKFQLLSLKHAPSVALRLCKLN